MKPKFLVLLATAVLWIGSLIGAYQIGHRRAVEAGETGSVADFATGASHEGIGRPNVPARDGRERNRSANKVPGTKRVLSQFQMTIGSGGMMNLAAMTRAMALLEKIQPEEIGDALAEVETLKNSQAKMLASMILLAKWADRDGPAAMNYVEEHNPGTRPPDVAAKMSVVSSWAEKDPEAVWQWYQDKKGEKTLSQVLPALFSGFMGVDPDSAFKHLSALDQDSQQMALMGMCQTATADSEKSGALLERIEAMPEGSEKSFAREMLMRQWTELCPKDVEDWIAKKGGGSEYDQAKVSLARISSRKDPVHAMNQAQTINNPELRFDAINAVFRNWERIDAAAANRALGQSGLTAGQIEKIRNSGSK